MYEYMDLYYEMKRLCVFRNLLEDEIVQDMLYIISEGYDKNEKYRGEKSVVYCEMVSKLYLHTTDWSEYMQKLLLEDENVYLRSIIDGNKNKFFEECVANELWTLSEFASLRSEDIKKEFNSRMFLPSFESHNCDFSKVYADRCHSIGKYGYGIYARANVFMLKNDRITPVESHDRITLNQLKGYEVQREKIIQNTKALLNGLPANNVLLYGDCGTGKSSTVKAIANDFASSGLRLIELKKNQLHDIGVIVKEIAKNPLKFIVFIDDLSFNEDDDNYAALKAALEGSVSSTADNMVIYATSNRRHLIKETFTSREGDEIHRQDTVQETLSLSERFGLQIRFMKPDKQQFLEIVHALAKQNGLKIALEELDKQAESFALSRGGRSPRLAKQFVQYLKGCEQQL